MQLRPREPSGGAKRSQLRVGKESKQEKSQTSRFGNSTGQVLFNPYKDDRALSQRLNKSVSEINEAEERSKMTKFKKLNQSLEGAIKDISTDKKSLMGNLRFKSSFRQLFSNRNSNTSNVQRDLKSKPKKQEPPPSLRKRGYFNNLNKFIQHKLDTNREAQKNKGEIKRTSIVDPTLTHERKSDTSFENATITKTRQQSNNQNIRNTVGGTEAPSPITINAQMTTISIHLPSESPQKAHKAFKGISKPAPSRSLVRPSPRQTAILEEMARNFLTNSRRSLKSSPNYFHDKIT